jgi:hypothetical protein
MKNFTITLQPPNPPMEAVEGMIITITAPYDGNSVTIDINPAVDEFINDNSSDGIEVRSLTFTRPTEATQTVTLKLNETAEIKNYTTGKNAILRLMNISKIKSNEGNFYSYEFFLENN